MKQSACSAVICQPGGREQKHDISFPVMNLANQLNLAKLFSFYLRHLKLSSKCYQCKFKAFQNI